MKDKHSMRNYSDVLSTMDEAAILNGIKIEILRDKRVELVKYINPNRHFDYLRSKCVLSGQDCEEIAHKVSTKERASVFLDKLLDHGPSAYDRLCESLLNERTQMFLLRMLNMEYENKKNNCMALFRPNVNRSPVLELAVDPDSLPRPPNPSVYQIRQRSISEGSSSPPNSNRQAELAMNSETLLQPINTAIYQRSVSESYRSRPNLNRSQALDIADAPERDQGHLSEDSVA